MRFPSIRAVAAHLRVVKESVCWQAIKDDNAEVGEEGASIDVRLQVHESGGWSIHTGDSSYDQDHKGFWGASCLGPDSNCEELASELLEEAKEHKAQEE